MARPRRVDQVQLLPPDDICCEQIVHVEAVRTARQQLPDPPTVEGVSALFSALGDPTRLRIVAALATQELCVCDLAATLGMSQSATSHQLRILRDLALVRFRREGRRIYYQLDDEHVTTLYSQALDHMRHQDKERA